MHRNYHATKLWSINDIDEAASCLQQGELVAFPTETVYGLGGNVYNDNAIKNIFHAKGRPADNPLIVHIHHMEQFNDLSVHVSDTTMKLINKFWPGPLTVIVQHTGAKKQVSKYCTNNLNTIAIRMPNHPIALQLLRKANVPIAAPSANTSGRPSPTMAKHVWNDLNGKIYGVVDGGETSIGVESTVIDCTNDKHIVILRPGDVSLNDIKQVVPHCIHYSNNNNDDDDDDDDDNEKKQPKAPGMKYTHYAPRAPLEIVYDDNNLYNAICTYEEKTNNAIVGVLITKERYEKLKSKLHSYHCIIVGNDEDLKSVAKNLYACLREFDDTNVTKIFSVAFPNKDIGTAIMNRLIKASSS